MKRIKFTKEFPSISSLNANKVAYYKSEFELMLDNNPKEKELESFVEMIQGKTISHFISMDDMNAEKVKMYEKFINSSNLFSWD